MSYFDHVVRVVVVPDRNGHGHTQVSEYWGDSWAVALQDEGATLKLFGKGDGADAKAKRDAALAQDFNGIKDHRWWHWVKRSKE